MRHYLNYFSKFFKFEHSIFFIFIFISILVYFFSTFVSLYSLHEHYTAAAPLALIVYFIFSTACNQIEVKTQKQCMGFLNRLSQPTSYRQINPHEQLKTASTSEFSLTALTIDEIKRDSINDKIKQLIKQIEQPLSGNHCTPKQIPFEFSLFQELSFATVECENGKKFVIKLDPNNDFNIVSLVEISSDSKCIHHSYLIEQPEELGQENVAARILPTASVILDNNCKGPANTEFNRNETNKLGIYLNVLGSDCPLHDEINSHSFFEYLDLEKQSDIFRNLLNEKIQTAESFMEAVTAITAMPERISGTVRRIGDNTRAASLAFRDAQDGIVATQKALERFSNWIAPNPDRKKSPLPKSDSNLNIKPKSKPSRSSSSAVIWNYLFSQKLTFARNTVNNFTCSYQPVRKLSLETNIAYLGSSEAWLGCRRTHNSIAIYNNIENDLLRLLNPNEGDTIERFLDFDSVECQNRIRNSKELSPSSKPSDSRTTTR